MFLGLMVVFKLFSSNVTLSSSNYDEAVIGWNDGNLPAIHKMTWNSNEFIGAIYYRNNVIAVSNEFIKNTSDGKLLQMVLQEIMLTKAKYMRAEARFLRAQSYYHALDLFEMYLCR